MLLPPLCAARSPPPSPFASLDDEQWGSAKVMLSDGTIDYYEVLGVDDDASPDEIKRAYRALAKECHPDYLGNTGHNICVMLNEAYDVLMDPGTRSAYDAQLEQALADDADDYTGQALSKWMPTVNPALARNTDPAEDRGVFVDEVSCIGCKQCVWHASATFRMEQEYGRSRVFAQWLNKEEELQAAIDSCPVSCIHWVNRADLPALEYVTQRVITERVNVGVMMAGQGRVPDVFAATNSFIKERRRKEEAATASKRKYSPAQEQARKQAMQDLMRDHLGFFAGWFDAAMAQMDAVVNGSDERTVGQRKRAARWQEREAAREAAARAAMGGADWFMVPPERALVPLTVQDRKRD